ncbi:MAG: hypothetical protein HY242_01510 [Afipia sp.]|nr:hypothetical protein [Afipia sp.]
MKPADLLVTFNRFKLKSGIVGVAYGPKEVRGSTRGNRSAVTFFVKTKLPILGARRRLVDGRTRLPKFIEADGATFPTDVVTINSDDSSQPGTRSPAQIYQAGGKISNMQITGTLGCLMTDPNQTRLYALTNQHIALSEGSAIACPDFRSVGAIVGTTARSVGLVADENFLPPFDNPQAYIDVDCALVLIPPNLENRFSPEIPNFGKPVGIFKPNRASPSAYLNSLLNLPVYSYSWASGARAGVISHVYYVYQQQPGGISRIACFLVKSIDDFSPGIPGDSGKLWMTKAGGQNLGVGVHSGVVADSPTSSRFALITELSSLSRFLNVVLAA